MAICQTGPLEYLLITSEGPQNPGSTGLSIYQFVDLVSSMPGVQNAYNLDGGSSSTLVFRMDGKNWQKINALSTLMFAVTMVIVALSALLGRVRTGTSIKTEEETK